jgi:hypothetical protein
MCRHSFDGDDKDLLHPIPIPEPIPGDAVLLHDPDVWDLATAFYYPADP